MNTPTINISGDRMEVRFDCFGADAYGVTKHAEQYRGWAQLPGAIICPAPMTAEEAARFIGDMAGCVWEGVLGVEDDFRSAYRDVVKRLHPDANGGQQHPNWLKLQEAADVLKVHHSAQAQA